MKKKVTLTLGELKTLLRKEILKEAEEKKEKEDSIDVQVDRFISSYEADSKIVKKESFNFRSAIRQFLSEGEDEPDKTGKKLTVEDIDIPNFVNNVVRLVTNYDKLLEIQDTILKRASNFLGENYDDTTVQAFKDALLDAYSIEIEKSTKDREEDYAPPRAGAAGPAGAGGA